MCILQIHLTIEFEKYQGPRCLLLLVIPDILNRESILLFSGIGFAIGQNNQEWKCFGIDGEWNVVVFGKCLSLPFALSMSKGEGF